MAAILKTRGSKEPESLTWLPKHNSMQSLVLRKGELWLEKQIWQYHLVQNIKLLKDINFHWNQTKLTFLQYGGHFEN